MPQLEHIEGIARRLWRAADALRANSNYASNEYFLPVMGLVFLRHAYNWCLAVRPGIEPGLSSRGGKTRPLTKEDFSQRNAIFLRPEAQFDRLVALKGRFREMHVVLPQRELTIRFSGIVGEMVSQIGCLARSNRKLAQARDLLLPRLMNGEISV